MILRPAVLALVCLGSAQSNRIEWEAPSDPDLTPLVRGQKRFEGVIREGNQSIEGKLENYFLQANRHITALLQSDATDASTFALVVGGAGVGKTFLVAQFKKAGIPVVDLSDKLIINEETWVLQTGFKIDPKPDLVQHFGQAWEVNKLPFPTVSNNKLLAALQLLMTKRNPAAKTLVIDSVDEIHPDAATNLLKEIDRHLFESNDGSAPARVILFGRPEGFAKYLRHPGLPKREKRRIIEFGYPLVATTADINAFIDQYVSYARLEHFPRDKVRQQIVTWITSYPSLYENMTTLANANFFIQEASRSDAATISELTLKTRLFRAMLSRNKDSHGRPESNSDAYVSLIEAIAMKYAPDVAEDGFFVTNAQESIKGTIAVNSQTNDIGFLVADVLDRSGLCYLRPANFNNPAYRFTPFWLHSFLVENHKKRKASPPGHPVGPPVTQGPPAPPKENPLAQYIFAGILGMAVLLMFFFGPRNPTVDQRRIAALVTALFAAAAAFLLTGAMSIKWDIQGSSKWVFSLGATGTMAVFIYVLWWMTHKNPMSETMEPGPGRSSQPEQANSPTRTARSPWKYDFNGDGNSSKSYGVLGLESVEDTTATYLHVDSVGIRSDGGNYLIQIKGKSNRPKREGRYSTAYFSIANPNWKIASGDILKYSIWYGATKAPIGLDLSFSDGSAMRDQGFLDQMNKNVHPNERSGYEAGRWHDFAIDLSKKVEQTVTQIVLAYDNGKTQAYGGFEAYISRIELSPKSAAPS